MPVPYTFGPNNTNFAFIVREANGYLSREEGVVASGSGILPGGTVMARDTATGFYVPYVAGGAGGAGTAAGILCEDVDATTADVKRTILVRSAEVQRAALAFAGAPSVADKNAAYASLAVSHIVMR